MQVAWISNMLRFTAQMAGVVASCLAALSLRFRSRIKCVPAIMTLADALPGIIIGVKAADAPTSIIVGLGRTGKGGN